LLFPVLLWIFVQTASLYSVFLNSHMLCLSQKKKRMSGKRDGGDDVMERDREKSALTRIPAEFCWLVGRLLTDDRYFWLICCMLTFRLSWGHTCSVWRGNKWHYS
jgi:hypothetical protein